MRLLSNKNKSKSPAEKWGFGKRKKLVKGIAFVIILVMACMNFLPSCEKNKEEKIKVTSDTLVVKKVEGLSDDFIFGMDASCVPSLERGGVKYYDCDGNEKDVYKILAENGVNYIRVRIWNDPFDKNGNGYGGGNCGIENAIEVGKRATQNGMKLLVNFHYSDFWADPQKQTPPKAWQGMSIDSKCDAIYEYTKESLKKLIDADIDIGMVQIGNETNGFMCGEKDWDKIAPLMSAGSKATREICPEALVVLHFSNPELVNRYAGYAYELNRFGVDYDVFASSYYSFWHGTFENLKTELEKVTKRYGKKAIIAETSYAYTAEDTDFHANTIGSGFGASEGYPFSVQGQANMLRDVIATAASIENCLGVFYWEGTWIAAGGSSYAENSVLWEKYGSGWASSFVAEYDPEDGGKWYGGCAVDNQALFDKNGRALESLKVFALVREGNLDA